MNPSHDDSDSLTKNAILPVDLPHTDIYFHSNNGALSYGTLYL
jgi:hypothetical protein